MVTSSTQERSASSDIGGRPPESSATLYDLRPEPTVG
jgi:hypothetical protein